MHKDQKFSLTEEFNKKQDARLAPGYFPPGPSISNPKNPEKTLKTLKKP